MLAVTVFPARKPVSVGSSLPVSAKLNVKVLLSTFWLAEPRVHELADQMSLLVGSLPRGY